MPIISGLTDKNPGPEGMIYDLNPIHCIKLGSKTLKLAP